MLNLSRNFAIAVFLSAGLCLSVEAQTLNTINANHENPRFSTQQNLELKAGLDTLIPSLLKKHNVPSISFAHITDVKIDLVAAYGEQTKGVKATPDTLYNIASLTKPITADIFLRLASASDISLDAHLSEYWNDPDLLTDERRHLLTPRLVLSHRTGLPNWRYETNDKLKFLRNPNTSFGYSGEGFEYLGRYMEKKTQTSLNQLAYRLVFEPNGMASTSHLQQDWFKDRIAVPSQNGSWLKPVFAKHALASDEIYTTATDYAYFMQSVMKSEGVSLALNAERLSVQTDRTEALCPFKDKSACPLKAGLGLGWEVYQFKDATFLMHTGTDRGEFTMAIIDMTHQDGMVLLTNSNQGVKVIIDSLGELGIDPIFTNYLAKIAAH